MPSSFSTFVLLHTDTILAAQPSVMFWRGPPLTQRVGQTSSEMSQRFALQEAALCRTPSHLVQNTQGQTDESFVVKLNEYWPERFYFTLALAIEHIEMKSSPSFLFLFLYLPVKNLNLKNTRSFSFVKSSSTVNTRSFMEWSNTKKKKLRFQMSQAAHLKSVDTHTAS